MEGGEGVEEEEDGDVVDGKIAGVKNVLKPRAAREKGGGKCGGLIIYCPIHFSMYVWPVL